jgi:hypothetical protein
MFKVTCIVDPRRTVGTPQKYGLESPRTMVLAQHYLSRSTHKQSINKQRSSNNGSGSVKKSRDA